MKIVETKHVINVGTFSVSKEWARINTEIRSAILSIQWPPESGSFTLFPEKEANGVKVIKDACMTVLSARYGWNCETPWPLISRSKRGAFDATCKVGDRLFGLEWETGNISSSHRSMNRMTYGIQKGFLIGGALILPTREMYQYLTDRVGNYRELAPYFPLWESCGNGLDNGLLTVFAIEHDALSRDVPKITKGTDGRALV